MSKVPYFRFAAVALAFPIADAAALAAVPPMPAFGGVAGAGSAAALSPLIWVPVVALVLGMCAALFWLLREPQRQADKPVARTIVRERARKPRRARPMRVPAMAQRRIQRRGWAMSPG